MSSLWSRVLWIVGVLAAAVVAVVLVAVAFGGGKGTATKAEYQSKVVNARDRVDFAMERITRSTSVDELIERIDSASQTVASAASELNKAEVAKGFDDENDKLVDALQALSDEMSNTAATFEDPSFSGTLDEINSLGFVQWDNVNTILSQLRKQGIRVPALERH